MTANATPDLATQVELDAHKASADHDGRYYTEAEVNAALAAHEADSTNVHGIANTASLLASGAAAGGSLGGTLPNPTLAHEMRGLGPVFNNLAGWNFDPILMNGDTVPGAGVGFYCKVWVPAAVTLSKAVIRVGTAGTGATPLANCYLGIFNAAGTRIGVTADQAAAWATNGDKIATVTADAGQSLAVTAGSYVYVGILVGTQSTTNVRINRTSNAGFVNAAMVAADGFREGTLGTGLTALPTSITVASLTLSSVTFWAAVR